MLGLNFVRHRLLGSKERGRRRYPTNVRRWANLSAIGDLTALDRSFADDYREMLDLGLVDDIVDATRLNTWFRNADGLNVHKCYGYMINPQLGAIVARWPTRDGSGTG